MSLLTKEEIKSILPHREPFLFVDEVIELIEKERCVALKHVREDEYYFKGHFPTYPVMPGVLILETMAQVGALTLLTLPQFKGKIGLFTGANKVKWRKQVLPNQTLKIETKIIKLKGVFGFAKAYAYVDDALACEAEISFAIQ